MKIAFSDAALPKTGALIVLATEADSGTKAKFRLAAAGDALDRETDGALTRALEAANFKGGKGKTVSLYAPAGIQASRIMVVGLGKPAGVTDLVAQEAGGSVYAELARSGEEACAFAVEASAGIKLKAPDLAANIAFGARLRSYRFDKYLTKQKPEDKPKLDRLTFHVKSAAAAKRAFQPLDGLADGVFLTRDLVSEPANVIYPESFAAEARKLSRLGIKVEVLDDKQLKKLGFGALLGVAQGSVRPPRVVIMRWENGPKKGVRANPVAFLGKGVTFDSGGISIKPSNGMWDMKWDMGGAGVVVGLMMALAKRKAKVNAIGIVGLVENMPSGSAQRPGDIVTSYSGQTIEVLNTDAEGRLVLADILWYCQERFKPRFMVNLATLTGAIIATLGHHYAGLFSNDDKISKQLEDSGTAVGEKLWRLPLAEVFDRMMDSKAADIKNIPVGGGAGSITAAQFLQRFVNDVPWAHLDIAGVTWSGKDAPTVPQGGTAFGVRLLDRFVKSHYEGR